MTAPQGLILFTGVEHPLSGSFTLTTGTTASTASLVIAPQATGIPAVGDLVIMYGGDRLVFPQSRVVDMSMDFDQSGYERWTLHIADGRWRWRYGTIQGRYNIRYLNNEFLSMSKRSIRTPHQLAGLLLDAMGVKRYDLSALPNDDFPQCDWEYARPAAELDKLLEATGCRLIYGPMDYVKIVRAGYGASLPYGSIMSKSVGFDPSEIPDELRFVAGRTLWQADLKLRPVALERDMSIVPLDKVSYKPTMGWGLETDKWLSIASDPNRANGPQDAALASESVFRWYQITDPVEFHRDHWGHENKEKLRLWQILPLMTTQIARADFADATTGNFLRRELPAWVWGQFWGPHAFQRTNLTKFTGNRVDLNFKWLAQMNQFAPERAYFQGYEIDAEHGVVKFGQPVFRMETDKKKLPHKPAELYLRVSYGKKSVLTEQFEHWELATKTGMRLGTNPQYFVHGDYGLRFWTDAKPGDNRKDGELQKMDNSKPMLAIAKYYSENVLRELQLRAPQSATYAGFMDIIPDGAIQQVRWWYGEDGYAYTQASRNAEMPQLAPTFWERRFYERVNSFMDSARKASSKQIGEALGSWSPGSQGAVL